MTAETPTVDSNKQRHSMFLNYAEMFVQYIQYLHNNSHFKKKNGKLIGNTESNVRFLKSMLGLITRRKSQT